MGTANYDADIKLALRAIESPVREEVGNAGGEPLGANAVLNGKGNYGFDAANETHGNMIEMGILDPTKVTRTALQNAVSVASLMLTTEAMVAEAPKDEAPASGRMPGGIAAWNVMSRLSSPEKLKRKSLRCGPQAFLLGELDPFAKPTRPLVCSARTWCQRS
jgi:hypothetical protein